MVDERRAVFRPFLLPFAFLLLPYFGARKDEPARKGWGVILVRRRWLAADARSVAGGGTGGDVRARGPALVACAGARERLLDARLDVALGLAADGGGVRGDEVARAPEAAPFPG